MLKNEFIYKIFLNKTINSLFKKYIIINNKMNSSKQDYKNKNKNIKNDRKKQRTNKKMKISSFEDQDLSEGIYDMTIKPTENELSYIYHEKEVKSYSSDCSDLFDNTNLKEEDSKKEDSKQEDSNDIQENTFTDDYFLPVVYKKK